MDILNKTENRSKIEFNKLSLVKAPLGYKLI